MEHMDTDFDVMKYVKNGISMLKTYLFYKKQQLNWEVILLIKSISDDIL